ncbi:MAG: hypothetical protein KH354_07150 [Clostridiales bacterium]|nr:hypothetical protein [Clostridiales bacterium]
MEEACKRFFRTKACALVCAPPQFKREKIGLFGAIQLGDFRTGATYSRSLRSGAASPVPSAALLRRKRNKLFACRFLSLNLSC